MDERFRNLETIQILAQGFRNCDLDCSMWSQGIREELAFIAIKALQEKGYQLYEYNPK